MNGFMLLVLVVLAGQVGPAGPAMPPSLNPVQPASMITTPPPQTDYGWQINPDTNLLEYIVQISPDKAEFMYKNSKEQESTIPAVVAARVSKIIVRFGTKPIQSTPIEQVMLLPLVNSAELASNLPTGRIKTLENSSGYDVQNVAGGPQPPALTPGIGSSLADAATSLSDRMAEAARDPDSLLAQNRTSPGSSFLQETMGNRGAATAPPTFPSAAGNSYNMPGSSMAGSGLPVSTATNPPTNPGYNNAQANGQVGTGMGMGNTGSSGIGMPGMGTAGMGTAGMGGNTLGQGTLGMGTTGAYGQPHSTAPGGSYTSFPNQNNSTLNTGRPGFATAPVGSSTLNPNSPSTFGYNNNSTYSNTTTPGYGATPGYNNTPGFSNTPGYNSTPGFNNSPSFTGTNPNYNQTPSYLPGHTNTQTGSGFRNDPPSVLLADQRNAVPSTSNGNVVTGGRSTWGTRTDGYPNDTLQDLNNQLPRSGMENIMPVMFVLSLVVNFYLGMLIRKLLGRYRTLLSSVRSQTI